MLLLAAVKRTNEAVEDKMVLTRWHARRVGLGVRTLKSEMPDIQLGFFYAGGGRGTTTCGTHCQLLPLAGRQFGCSSRFSSSSLSSCANIIST
ncbi:hypothetical protein FA95DRAFT_1189266 [Auriscalpium vulgare]|uniref:Uncharacterized protein n=1 Tax=Auriscalpium vulgare TaxID=40419 RepID=A0ACB8RW39_9AGAM|nr:hypothetical protein FA95DRAFT_1189266 [Auriscalpium vulgare]